MRNPWMLGLALGLHGCADSKETCDSVDTACEDSGGSSGTPPETPSIDQINWDCDETTFRYEVLTVGWTGDGTLQIVETGDTDDNRWEEEHPLPSIDFDPDGWFDQLYLDLDILQEPYCDRDPDAENACWQYQAAGESTLWTCDDATLANLTWAVTIYDDDDPTDAVECQTWGHDTSYFPDCTPADEGR